MSSVEGSGKFKADPPLCTMSSGSMQVQAAGASYPRPLASSAMRYGPRHQGQGSMPTHCGTLGHYAQRLNSQKESSDVQSKDRGRADSRLIDVCEEH